MRTHLTIEPDNFYNRATNLLFIPLHHVIGQNKYQCLKGKATHIPPEKSPSGALFSFSTLKKVVFWIGAFIAACVFTWFGLITRRLSFSSPDVNRAYTLAFLMQLPDNLFESLNPNQFPGGLYECAQTARMLAASPNPASSAPSTPASTASSPSGAGSSFRPTVPMRREVLLPDERPEVQLLEKRATNVQQTQYALSIRVEFLQFMIDLSQLLVEHPTETEVIETWLHSKITEEDYPSHFFMAEIHLHDLYMQGSNAYRGTKNIYEVCVKRLSELGLGGYVKEAPTPRFLESQRTLLADDPLVTSFTESCLSVLRPLSEVLQRLSGSKEKNQTKIKAWFVKTKTESRPKYNNPFFFAPYVLLRNKQGLLTGILDGSTLRELSQLYTECQTRLLELELKEIIEETPPKRDLGTEIEQALQNPSDSGSKFLKHLRFYLTKHSEIIKRLISPELLARCERVFETQPEEAPDLPSSKDLDAVITFYKVLVGEIRRDKDAALSWLKRQMSSPEYCFPFYYSSYWQTVGDVKKNEKLFLMSEFHKKAMAWLTAVQLEQLLLEEPPNEQPGLCLLVRAIADVKPEAPPEQPTAATNLAPPQQLAIDYSTVDDSLFKSTILELQPHMAPCLENPEMYRYWKNSLLDRAIYFCISRFNICQKVQTFKTKAEVIQYFKALKAHFGNIDTMTLLSQGYVRVIDRLAPLLPTNFVDNWRREYTQCCQFLERISAKEYFTGKALPFLGDDSIFEQQLNDEMRETSNLFKRLEKVTDEQFLKTFQNDEQIKKNKGRPFWFSRELKDLYRGYGVSFIPKELKKINRLFTAITERLKRLELGSLLEEAPPIRNFLTLRMLGISDENIEKLKLMS